MRGLRHNLLWRMVKLLNIALVTVPFAVLWYVYFMPRAAIHYYEKGNWLVIAIFVILYVIFARVYDAFLISVVQVTDMFFSQLLAIVISDALMYIILLLLLMHLPNLLICFAALAIQLLLSLLWCLISHEVYHRIVPAQKAAVIYDMRKGMETLIKEYGLDKKYDIVWTAEVVSCISDLTILNGLETVFLSGVHSHDRNVILKYCVEHKICVFVVPRIGDTLMSGARQVHVFHLPILRVGSYSPTPEYLFVKRLLDILISAIALIITSPIFLVTAIAIKKYDGGPVFYKQKRLTQDGRVFEILKFRSMKVDAEKDGVARMSTGENDDRITPPGHVIRKFRIDELPQLLNILKSDMSICGPRPERPEIAAEYEKELPEFRLRLQAKAGLTGYAQVYGKYNTIPYDKLQMDLMYIARPSIAQDLRIMFATVKILFQKESTEGVEQGQTTAL